MIGLTQKNISRLSALSNTTVSRYFTKENVEPINKVGAHTKNLKYDIKDVRDFFNKIVFPVDWKEGCKTLCFYNFKGGTGKTSMCFQISSHLAFMGFNVLVVDSDPQGHLSTSMGFDQSQNLSHPTLADVVSGLVDIRAATHSVYEGLDFIPANLSLTKLEMILNDLPKREERIKFLIEEVKNQYDFIIFDTNPNISVLNRNILVASDLVAIVCETQPYSLNGLKLLMEDTQRFYENMRLQLPDIFIIPNKYEDRSTNSAEAMSVLRQYYEKYMIPNFAIRRSEDINTAAKLSKPLAFFARTNSMALEDVSDLIHALLEKLNSKIKFNRQSA